MMAGPFEVLVGLPMPDMSKVRGHTKSNLPVLQARGFCTGPTTLSCKKLFVTETAACNLHESPVQKGPPESMPWAGVNAENENIRKSAGNGIRMTESVQSRKEATVMTTGAVSPKTGTLIRAFGMCEQCKSKVEWCRSLLK